MLRNAGVFVLALAACRTSDEARRAEAAPAADQAIPATPLVIARAEAPAAPRGADARARWVHDRIAAHAEAMNAWMTPYRALKTPDERREYTREHPRPDAALVAQELWPLVEADARDDAAFQALDWLLRNDRKQRARASEFLMEGFRADARVAGLVPMLGRTGEDLQPLEVLAEESPHREVRGLALYEQVSRLKDAEAPDEARIVALLERIRDQYGDIQRGRRTLGQSAGGDLREIQHLSVGKVAPDIVGEDIDGVAFKLSDYRGKLVLLDFWGDW